MVAFALAWATRTRKPAVGELLYWEKDGLRVYSVANSECDIRREASTYDLSLWLDSLGQSESGQPDRNAPTMEVSICFPSAPLKLIVENARFQIVSRTKTGLNLTNIARSDEYGHGDLVDGYLIVNRVSSTHIDMAISGCNNADGNARISVRALFRKTGGFSAPAKPTN